MLSIFKYRYLTKNNQFVQALALLPKRWRYCSSRQIWMAFRLGMYTLVLSKTPWKKNKHYIIIQQLSLLKRHQKAPVHKLLDEYYSHFHTEIIHELIVLRPKLVYEYLSKHIDNEFLNWHYSGLYIALALEFDGVLATQRILSKYQCTAKDLLRFSQGVFLYSNGWLETSAQKIVYINQFLARSGLSPICLINTHKPFYIDNLSASVQKIIPTLKKMPLVSVIVTCYQSADYIVSCINSLRAQTWCNLQIIVVDDASTDESVALVQKICDIDTRVQLVRLAYNVGTFVAKSIGANYAKGEFLTCQDSDDWAHPQKIAEQVQPLLEQPDLVATLSQWIRIDKTGQYYVRQFFPFLRQNPASLMFRFKLIKNKIGLWHTVRVGADSEFIERLKTVFGSNRCFLVKKLLTFASHRSNSLTTSDEFGVHGQAYLERLDYWEAWRSWHIDSMYHNKTIYVPPWEEQMSSSTQLFTGVPKNNWVQWQNNLPIVVVD